MTSCIFYDKSPANHERQLFELVERAYNQRKKVVIYARDEARAAMIDRTLWILKQEAFIPHRIVTTEQLPVDVPVAIVNEEMNPISADILIVDGHCSLDFASKFESIHEFVDRSSPELHQSCRDRFRDYRTRQIPVEYSKTGN